MAIGALALYVPEGSPVLQSVLILAAAFFLTALPSTIVWCLFGTAIARFLHTDRRVAIFNVLMAVLLVLSMIPTLL
jgi:threonine/homoserine/homoserine lactone efflux protein